MDRGDHTARSISLSHKTQDAETEPVRVTYSARIPVAESSEITHKVSALFYTCNGHHPSSLLSVDDACLDLWAVVGHHSSE